MLTQSVLFNMTQARVVRCLEVPGIDVVSSHAFSQDLSVLAVSPNNEEIHIFRVGQEFQKECVLSKHTQRVSGLSFSSDGRLVSVSEDRTAFVWRYNQGQKLWEPSIVELKSQRAANCVEWSPDGSKFAVGLSSKEVAICTYNEEHDVWGPKKIGKFKAAVGTLAWHPNGSYLATGSADRQVHIYDSASGESQLDGDMGAWVNGIAFSESGRFVAVVPHDSTVRFKDLNAGAGGELQRVRWKGLPFLKCAFLSDSLLVACGFDKVPVLFKLAGNSWQVVGSIDAAPKASTAQFAQAGFNKFKGGGGQDDGKATHLNTITSVRALGGNKFSTSGLDGQVVLWELSG